MKKYLDIKYLKKWYLVFGGLWMMEILLAIYACITNPTVPFPLPLSVFTTAILPILLIGIPICIVAGILGYIQMWRQDEKGDWYYPNVWGKEDIYLPVGKTVKWE